MSTGIEGGRPIGRFRLLGFPVHLDASFLVVMGILALASGFHPAEFALWMLITPVAVLVHELGHAVVARSAGGRPAIALAGFGGETTLNLPGPLSRARSIAISVAGPAVGLVIGAVLLVVDQSIQLTSGGLAATAMSLAIFTTIGWSVLNLLPILPLDGGQTLRELLPGTPQQRARRAAMASIAAAVLAGIVLWRLGFLFAPIFFAWFAVSNAAALRRPKPAEQAGAPLTPEQSVVGLLWQGSGIAAYDLMNSLPPGAVTDMAVHGAVLAVAGDRTQGYALLQQEAARRPADPNPLALLVLAHTLRHEWGDVLGLLTGPRAAEVPPSVVDRAVQEARRVGDPATADRIAAAAARAAPA